MKKFKEKSEISLHLIKIWNFLKGRGEKWCTAKDIHAAVKFAESTVRAHAIYLVRSGLVDQIEVFPGHRYRIAKSPEKRNKNFFERLEHAAEVMKE